MRTHRFQHTDGGVIDFPSFSEGLSLRNAAGIRKDPPTQFPFLFGGTFIEDVQIGLVGIGRNEFPFLFGGTFIEDEWPQKFMNIIEKFPFLFGGTFIEDSNVEDVRTNRTNFPSFSEGLSLRTIILIA